MQYRHAPGVADGGDGIQEIRRFKGLIAPCSGLERCNRHTDMVELRCEHEVIERGCSNGFTEIFRGSNPERFAAIPTD